jgi:hypothetical protein
MTWENLLNEAQIQESELLAKTKKKIENYREIEEGIKLANETLENPEEDDDVEEVQETLDAFENDLEKLDKAICKEIKALQKEKSAAPASVSASAPALASSQIQNANTKNADGKKDNSIGWLIFGGLALVATLGAVNLFKNK